ADEGDATPAARLTQLDLYSAKLDCIERGEAPADAPFAALAAAIDRHALPLQPFRDLLSAFRQDVIRARYAEFAQVLDYCSRSASACASLRRSTPCRAISFAGDRNSPAAIGWR